MWSLFSAAWRGCSFRAARRPQSGFLIIDDDEVLELPDGGSRFGGNGIGFSETPPLAWTYAASTPKDCSNRFKATPEWIRQGEALVLEVATVRLYFSNPPDSLAQRARFSKPRRREWTALGKGVQRRHFTMGSGVDFENQVVLASWNLAMERRPGEACKRGANTGSQRQRPSPFFPHSAIRRSARRGFLEKVVLNKPIPAITRTVNHACRGFTNQQYKAHDQTHSRENKSHSATTQNQGQGPPPIVKATCPIH